MTSQRTEKNADDDTTLQTEYYAILQRCRKAEREKKREVGRFRVLFCKYKNELDFMKSENENLNLQLSLINCIASRKKDEKSIGKLKEFIIISDQIMKRTEKERQKQVELDRQIHYWNEKSRDLMKSGALSYTEHLNDYTKSKAIIENKLQRANEKLGLLCASVSKIRGEIDIMYVDRRLFVEKWKKLISEMARISQEKNKLVKSSLAVHDEREKLSKKIRVVSAKNEKDRDLFDTEIKERQRMKEYIGRLQIFMKTKSKSRYKHLIMPKREDQAVTYELKINQLEEFEEAFKKLCDLLGVTEVEKIVEIFISKEAEINRAVEYTNAQDFDCSKIKEEIDQLEEEKAKTLDEMKANAKLFREQILHLDEKYTNARAKAMALTRSLRRARRKAKHVLRGIKFLTAVVHLDTDAEADLDSSPQGRAEKTMMALEQRIGQIYDLYKELKNKSEDGVTTKVPDTPTNLQTDSALSEDNATTDGIDDLPSVGETFDEISVDSGNISQPISEAQLRKLML